MLGNKFDYIRLPYEIGESIRLERIWIFDPVADEIKIGTGENAIRKIFQKQTFDSYESSQLSKFKQVVMSLPSYKPEYHGSDFLLRFLYANKFDFEASQKVLSNLSIAISAVLRLRCPA